MKKIMINDRYGLTKAVLYGRKTMTRRIIKGEFEKITAFSTTYGWYYDGETKDGETIEIQPQYWEGEKVAVAQPYKDTDVLSFNAYLPDGLKRHKEMLSSAGYRNKMFVKAEYMPHRIRITNIKVERLRDISEEDCMKEGIMEGEFMNTWDTFYFDMWGDVPNHITFKTPHEAFASLIDRISGKGTWERNPWVYAYEFELIK